MAAALPVTFAEALNVSLPPILLKRAKLCAYVPRSTNSTKDPKTLRASLAIGNDPSFYHDDGGLWERVNGSCCNLHFVNRVPPLELPESCQIMNLWFLFR